MQYKTKLRLYVLYRTIRRFIKYHIVNKFKSKVRLTREELGCAWQCTVFYRQHVEKTSPHFPWIAKECKNVEHRLMKAYNEVPIA